MRLRQKDKVDIIKAYESDLTPMVDLAKRYGITRQGIYKVLKSAGVDTTKRKIPVSCTTCGNPVDRTKARIRRQLHHFCDQVCYNIFLEVGNGSLSLPNRHGTRIARLVVSRFFSLQEGHIVHHEDRNQLNNKPNNLKVFANQGDHIRYHRGFDVKPLWEG